MAQNCTYGKDLSFRILHDAAINLRYRQKKFEYERNPIDRPTEIQRNHTYKIGLLGVWHIDDSLGSGNIVDGGNATVNNTEVFKDNLDNRSQTVGGTGCVCDKLGVIAQKSVVATQDNVQGAFFLDGGRHDNLLDSALFKVWFQGLDLQEFTGTFHHQLDSFAGPVNLGEIFFATEGNNLSVDSESGSIFEQFNFLVPGSVDGIVLNQVSGTFDGADIVHVDNLERRIVPNVSERKTANTTKSINSALGNHFDIV